MKHHQEAQRDLEGEFSKFLKNSIRGQFVVYCVDSGELGRSLCPLLSIIVDLLTFSQAGRRGFEPRLPLHIKSRGSARQGRSDHTPHSWRTIQYLRARKLDKLGELGRDVGHRVFCST